MTKILTVPYEATLPSFGSPAARKHVRPRDFVLQGNNGAWVTIPSTEYELDKKNGIVRQRSEDSAGNEVDWESYSSYRWSGTIVTSGSRATVTNEALTFADADYADIEAGPDEQVQESLASDSVEQDDNSSDESQSDNYVAGVSGYFIDRVTGNAEFNNITARGTIVATAGSIGGWTITATALYKDTGVDATSAGMSPSDYPFYAGAVYSNRANAPYRVLPDGSVFATQYFKIGSNDLVFDNATDQLVWLKGLSFDRLDVATTGTFNLDTQGRSWVRLTGTAAAKTIPYIKKPSNIAGQILIIKNDANPVTATKTSQLTLKNNQGSPPAGYAALSLYGKNVVLKNFGTVTLIYDSANARWTLAAVVKATKTKNNSELSEEGYDEDVSVIAALPTSTSVRAGTDVLTLSAGTLAVDMDIPASSTWTMELVTPADGTTWLFANGDTAYMRQGASEVYFTVTRDTNDSVTQTYTCTFANGTRPLSFAAGSGVLNYGASGQGFIYQTVASGLPYLSVRTHTGSPWSSTERVRLGALTGITDPTFGALSGYGLWTDNVYLTGAIKSTSGQIGGWTIGASSLTGGNTTLHSSGYLLLGTSNDVVRLDAADATYRLWIGNAAAASAPFRVSKAGALTSTSGTIGGFTIGSTTLTATNLILDQANQEIRLGSANNIITLDAADATYRLSVGHATHSNAPFNVTQAGEVTASNITATGTIKATVFQKALVSAFAGSLLVAKSASALDSSATATGTTFTVVVKSQAGAPFASGDYIYITDGTNATWATVGAPSGTGPYTYTATYASGSSSATYAPGMTVIDYGQSGQGYLYATADNADGPFYSVRTWTTNPYTGANVVERARLGNLKNSFGIGANNYYGFAAGDYSGGNYLRYDPTNGFVLSAGGAAIALDASGERIVASTAFENARSIRFVTSLTAGANLFRLYTLNQGSAVQHRQETVAVTSKDAYHIEDINAASTRYAYKQINANVSGVGTSASLLLANENGVKYGELTADLVFGADNSYDIGTNTSTGNLRPRDLLLARNATIGGTLTVTGATTLDSMVFVGDNANANAATASITVNQGNNNNEAFAVKRLNVAHGMTTLTETDTYFTVSPFQTTNGGARLEGYSTSTVGLYLHGISTTANTARSTSAVGAVVADASKKSGTGKSSMGTNGNLFVVRNDASTQFLVDAEGDIHMNATSNINAWDEYDDLALLEAYRVKTAQPSNYRRAFAHDVEMYARILHDTGVLTLNPDGHHFVSMKGLFGLTIDALRQLALRVNRYERALSSLGVDVQALDA